ncbi:unnamed protein product [Staurois parvus]|uniref:Uncharacterized protein n=1 Tax=Staurois parvus TaxID=386267 RepID=A0ABN9HUM1_9NEOB|nr:unnamed protein product [Staurois parvus]
MLTLVCIARKSACNQHRAQSALSGQRSGVLHPPRAERKLHLQALTSALLKSQDCSNC